MYTYTHRLRRRESKLEMDVRNRVDSMQRSLAADNKRLLMEKARAKKSKEEGRKKQKERKVYMYVGWISCMYMILLTVLLLSSILSHLHFQEREEEEERKRKVKRQEGRREVETLLQQSAEKEDRLWKKRIPSPRRAKEKMAIERRKEVCFYVISHTNNIYV